MVIEKKVSDFEVYNTNPSCDRIEGLGRLGEKEEVTRDGAFVDRETGEAEDAAIGTGEYKIVGFKWNDSRRFVKMFEGAEDVILKLSLVSVGVLMYVTKQLKNGSDIVRIDSEDCRIALGYKGRKSVYDGVLGLLRHRVIYRKTGGDGEYFINVNLLFRGHRWKLKDR